MCHRFGSNIMTTTALESPSASSMVRLSGPLVELTAAEAKGQLILKCPFGVYRSSKTPTQFFPGFLP